MPFSVPELQAEKVFPPASIFVTHQHEGGDARLHIGIKVRWGRRQNAPRNPSSQSEGIGTGVTAAVPPSSEQITSIGRKCSLSHAPTAGKYRAVSQNDCPCSGVMVRTTTRSLATRRSSASPRMESDQWCNVRIAMAASKVSSANGRPQRSLALPAQTRDVAGPASPWKAPQLPTRRSPGS